MTVQWWSMTKEEYDALELNRPLTWGPQKRHNLPSGTMYHTSDLWRPLDTHPGGRVYQPAS